MRNKYNKTNEEQHLPVQKSNGSDQKEISLDLMADWNPIIKLTIIKYQKLNYSSTTNKYNTIHYILRRKVIENEYNKTNE